jgi:hypothetical protein
MAEPMSRSEAVYRIEDLESQIVVLMTRDEPNNIVKRELAERTKLALEYCRHMCETAPLRPESLKRLVGKK